MNARERGFLLLTCHMGDLRRKVLTIPQLRVLAVSVTCAQDFGKEGEVTAEELMKLGFNRPSAQRILDLLAEEERLDWYLENAVKNGCVAITRANEKYPLILRQRLGMDSPGCLWAKGDRSLLELPAISLVGSRELREENLAFARKVGVEAAKQGLVLVSGNAKGADAAAQDACLAAGGKVISVVADRLDQHPQRERVLYLSEDGYDLPFSTQRALSRNRVIHALGRKTFVAQCTLEKGGTWDGTMQNLKKSWSPVYCFDDESEAVEALKAQGAQPIHMASLEDIPALQTPDNLLDR